MKKILLLSVLFGALGNSYAMSNADFLTFTSDSASVSNKNSANFYAQGIATGYMVFSIFGKERVMCFPSKMNVTEFNYRNIVAAEMEYDKSVTGEFPFSLTLYNAFKRRFPCQ